MRKKHIFAKAEQGGFTLVELMIATGILAFVFSGIMVIFVRCIELSELATNSSIALSAAKSCMEEIKNTAPSQIITLYQNKNFSVSGLNGGRLVTYANNSTPADLIAVRVVVCWRERSGRVIGTDTNLNGSLDGGELNPGDGEIHSPIHLEARIYEE